MDSHDHPMRNVAYQSRLASFLDAPSISAMNQVNRATHDAIMNYSDNAWMNLADQETIDRAGKSGNVLLLRKAVELRMPVNHIQALRSLLKRGLVDAILSVFDTGLSPNTHDDGVTMLHVAVRTRNLKLTEGLLKRGADPNLTSGPGQDLPLVRAYKWRDYPIVKLLLEYGADPFLYDQSYAPVPRPGSSAFEHFIYSHDTQAVQMMLELNHPNLERRLVNDRTILEVAVRIGDPAIVSMLLRAGADFNVRVNYCPGDSYVHWGVLGIAAGSGHIEVVKELLRAGASTRSDRDSRRLSKALMDNPGKEEIVKLIRTYEPY